MSLERTFSGVLDAVGKLKRLYRAQALKNAAETSGPGPVVPPPPARKVPVKAAKKDVKSLLKGVVVKKKPNPGEGDKSANPMAAAHGRPAGQKREAETGEADAAEKRQRTAGR